MRITGVTLHPVSTRRETGLRNQHVIVRLEADSGIVGIGTAAQLHLATAMPNLTHPGDCTGPVLYQDDVAADRVRYEHSHALVPEGIGWGIALDEGMLDTLHAPLTMVGV